MKSSIALKKVMITLSGCFCMFIFFGLGGASVCRGDVLFIHDYKTTEFLKGEQEARLHVAVTPDNLFIDKQVRYTGDWMKRFFGKVTESRHTTHFMLEEAQIREIDWTRNHVNVYPFARFTDLAWFQKEQESQAMVDDILKARYRALDPVLSVTEYPEMETVAGYACRKVDAHLRLETRDLRKNAASVTLIQHTLWLSDAVPGIAEYDAFYQRLGEQLGTEAQRLGNLSFILRYWHLPLDTISDELAMVRGFAVKRVSTVEARYKADIDSDSPRISTRIVKEETSTLESVVQEDVDISMFMAPETFRLNYDH